MDRTIIVFLLVLGLILGAVTPSTFADSDDEHEGKVDKKNRVWTGDGPPPSKLGQLGDLYIDNSSPDFPIYKKTAKRTWTVIGTLQGPPGEKGDKGDQGEKGEKGDTGPQGPPGTINAQSCPAGFFVSGIDTNGNLICTPLIERPATCSVPKVPGVDLHACDFHDQDLTGVDLSGADLRGVNLSGATLTGANLSGATLNLANLNGATLTGTDFSGASLVSADLTGTNLDAAIVVGANMMDALLPAGIFAGCLNHSQCS